MKFQAAYEECKDSVYAYLVYMTHDAKLAEDLSQETFLRMFLHMNKFRGESGVKTWALTIARNVFLSYARKKQPVLMEEMSKDLLQKPLNNQSLHASPEEHVLKQEKENQVRECLQFLGEQDRTALLLRDYEQLSYEEISKILGISLEAVKSRIYRARQNFKKVYVRLMGDEQYG